MTVVIQGSEGRLALTVRAEEYRTLGEFTTSSLSKDAHPEASGAK
jgi:hypothetical protein